MEKVLLGASLRSRDTFQLITSYIEDKKYSRGFQIVFDQVRKYYNRDENVQLVDPDVLKAVLAESTMNDKHIAEFHQIVNDSLAIDISEVNVRNLVLSAKKQELGLALASALIENKDTADLLEHYQEVSRMTELEELTDEGVELIDSSSFLSILREEADPAGRLVVYPTAISDRIGGGLRPGHHVVVYAPTEAGKTALTLTMAAGFARQRAPGLYFGNEDRPQDMLVRLVSCLTGLTNEQVMRDPEAALAAADANGLAYVRFLSAAPGTPRQIEDFIKKYNPRWIILDQLRNVAMKAEGRVQQLEAAACWARSIAKKYGLVVISVTQAADSAMGKEVLIVSDIDSSKVGIPSQADVLIAIGITPALENQGVRCFTLPKNKLTGNHDHFYVALNPAISRYTSL